MYVIKDDEIGETGVTCRRDEECMQGFCGEI